LNDYCFDEYKIICMCIRVVERKDINELNVA